MCEFNRLFIPLPYHETYLVLQQDQFTTGSRVQGALLLPPQYTNYQQQPLLTNQFWPNCNKTSYDQVIYQNLYANYEQQPLPTNQFWPNYYETIYDEVIYQNLHMNYRTWNSSMYILLDRSLYLCFLFNLTHSTEIWFLQGGGAEGLLGRDNYPHI